jgi:hypothetical protein
MEGPSPPNSRTVGRVIAPVRPSEARARTIQKAVTFGYLAKASIKIVVKSEASG